MAVKLVCFDLDDTLIREVDSLMLPCILNGKKREHSFIQAKEDRGELDYIKADYLKAKLLSGLKEDKIRENFLNLTKPLKNISQTVSKLQKHGIKCIVITVGPRQVAKVVSDLWGFDAFYGSEYEVINGIFTGEIINYLNSDSKAECLLDYCSSNGYKTPDCVSVGDGSTDIPVFELCGKSIAINASEKVKARATHYIDTDDLYDILSLIL